VRDVSGNLGWVLQGKSLLIMGAGGAAQAVVGALLDAGAGPLVIANRTVAKAQALAARFSGVSACGYEALEGRVFDVAINATSAGLSGEAPALPRGILGKHTLAYDMVYGRETPFLAAARGAGARACDGLGMLVEQAAESFFIWRGVRPETRLLLQKLRGG
jgi:shikimate dehydrogenase